MLLANPSSSSSIGPTEGDPWFVCKKHFTEISFHVFLCPLQSSFLMFFVKIGFFIWFFTSANFLNALHPVSLDTIGAPAASNMNALDAFGFLINSLWICDRSRFVKFLNSAWDFFFPWLNSHLTYFLDCSMIAFQILRNLKRRLSFANFFDYIVLFIHC